MTRRPAPGQLGLGVGEQPAPEKQEAPIRAKVPASFYSGTLASAKEQFERAIDRGERTICPCCDRPAKRYKRKLHSGMAAALIRIFRASRQYDDGWVPVTEIYTHGSSGDYAKLRFWGLIESKDKRTLDDNASGYWRLTNDGMRFVDCAGVTTVSQYVYVYENRKVGEAGPQVSIIDVLGTDFDYQELMHGKV